MRKAAALTVLALALATAAYPAASGTLRVHLSQGLGAGIVTINSSVLLQPRAQTLVDGEALFLALPAGRYEVALHTADGALLARGEATVRAGTSTLAELTLPHTITDETTVLARPLPSPTLSEHLQLPDIERLPVARDYRGYPQLVAGVAVVPNHGGLETPIEPVAKGGNSYVDRNAYLGSRDNTYFLDGFDVTGHASGAGDFAFSNEIILEQHVITSGVPAEYAGGAGMVADVVTRSGGPAFSGSVNYYRQDPHWADDWKTDDTRLQPVRPLHQDGGFTLGGPVLHERLWFFVAGQRRESEDHFTLSPSASPTPGRGTFLQRRDNGFVKLTAQPAPWLTVAATGYREPKLTTGTRDPNSPPTSYLQGKERTDLVSLLAQATLGPRWLFEAKVAESEQQARSQPEHPEAGPPNNVLFPPGTSAPTYQRVLGSGGAVNTLSRPKRQVDLSASRFLTRRGDHAIEAGYQYRLWGERVGTKKGTGVRLTSLAPHLASLTLGEARAFNFLAAPDYDAIYRELSGDPGSAAFAAADADGDGILSPAEFAALRFTSTAGNAGGVNFLRTRDVALGVNDVRQRVHVLYVQGEWRRGRFSVSAGVRAEQRSYFASDGSTILDADPVLLPRLGATWELGRDGGVISFVAGRYADPLRADLIRFAGHLSGNVFADEIFIGGDWYTWRLNGSRTRQRSAVFAPNLKNEVQDELAVTWDLPLPRSLSLTAQLFYRRDRHLVEDIAPRVYFDPAVAGEYTLSPGDYGFSPEGPGNVGFFVGNLVGAERETWGVDLELRRRWTERWGGSLQYSWREAEGNSNADASGDLQGEFVDIDPRQPHMWGDLPGTVPHQLKLFGAYRFPVGIEVGTLVYWSAGSRFTEADILRPTSSRVFYNHRRADGTYVRTGTEQQPSWSTVSLRLGYERDLPRGFRGELFLDVFNLLDDQKGYLVEEAHNDPQFRYREPRAVLEPRRYQLGARLAF